MNIKKFLLLLLAVTPLYAQGITIPVPMPAAKDAYAVENSGFMLCYAGNYGLPVWEMHMLKPDMFIGGALVNGEWKADTRVKSYRITAKDIAGSKLEPVQLFPKSHGMNNIEAQNASFYTSNLVFMSKQLKDSIWDRITASFEELAKKYGTVYVYAGPIYDKDPLKIKYTMNNRIATPAFFYRIVLYNEDGKPRYKCYRFPNRVPTDYERTCSLDEYAYNIYQLEADTDIDFFDRETDGNFRQDKVKFLDKRSK